MPTPTVITDLDPVAANNFPAGSNAPSVLDDVQRAHGAFIRQTYDAGATKAAIQAQTYTAFTAGGTSTAVTLTPSPAITAYAAGQSFWTTFPIALGLNPTININGLGATVNLVKQNADGAYSNIASGDVPANHRSRVTLLSTTQALIETLPALGVYMIHVRDEKASGTSGGSNIAGSQVRTLNTVVTNTITGASLATDRVTLPAGKYRVWARAPAYAAGFSRIRLVNVTDAAVVALGSNAWIIDTVNAQVDSIIQSATFTLSATKEINLTHYTSVAQATLGLGRNVSDSFVEVYAEMIIWKE